MISALPERLHITKLAIKWTPTRELQQHGAVCAYVDEIIARQGGLGDGRLLLWHIDMPGRAILQVTEKAREGFFDLAKEEVINIFHLFPIGSRVWPAGDHRFASPLGTGNHLLK